MHLSTAVILFFLTSLFLGVQFIRFETEWYKKRTKEMEKTAGYIGVVFFEDFNEPFFSYGVPFQLLSVGHGYFYHKESEGYYWHTDGIIMNGLAYVFLLLFVGSTAEFAVRRKLRPSTLKPPGDNV